jgi:hypothetical protein
MYFINLKKDGRHIRRISSRLSEGVIVQQLYLFEGKFDEIHHSENISESSLDIFRTVAKRVIPAAVSAGIALGQANKTEEGRKKFSNAVGKLREDEDSVDAVESAITWRIMHSHPEVLGKHGPEKVMMAIRDEAEWVGDVDEIGSSDVSIWTKNVLQSLERRYGESIEEDSYQFIEEGRLGFGDKEMGLVEDTMDALKDKFNSGPSDEMLRKRSEPWEEKVRADMAAGQDAGWFLDRKQGAGQKWTIGTKTWFDVEKYQKERGGIGSRLKRMVGMGEETKPEYNKDAVNKEIKKDPKIKGKEAKAIHALLKGRTAKTEDAAVGTIPASGTKKPIVGVKPSQGASVQQGGVPVDGEEEDDAVVVKKNTLTPQQQKELERKGINIKMEADADLQSILNQYSVSYDEFKAGGDITDNPEFFEALKGYFASEMPRNVQDPDEWISNRLDNEAGNLPVANEGMDMNLQEIKAADLESDDIDTDMVATADDQAQADKNIIMQIRKASDYDKPTKIRLGDGTQVVIGKKAATKIAQAFDKVRPQAKAEIQQLLNMKDGFAGVMKHLGIMKVDENTLGEDVNDDEVRELTLYADNDGDLYRQSAVPIMRNLTRKYRKGVYDPELAVKLWKYHADRAAKKYGKEHGNDDGFKIFSPAVRMAAAREFAENWTAELEAGNAMESVNAHGYSEGSNVEIVEGPHSGLTGTVTKVFDDTAHVLLASGDTAIIDFTDGRIVESAGPVTREGKSPHKKGTEKYKKHMAAMHAGMNEERGEQYTSLSDVYPEGPTEIWYWKEDNGRDYMMGPAWLASRREAPTPESIPQTHVLIGTVKETNPEKVFHMMQGEIWSPEGQAYNMIVNSGSGHTSMSVGDVVKVGNKWLMVDRFGFQDIENIEQDESVKMSGAHMESRTTAAAIAKRVLEDFYKS